MKLRLLVALSLLLPPALSSQTEFSRENASRLLRKLSVEVGPRPMGSPAEQEAMRFAVRTLRSYGCDTAFIMPMDKTSSANTSSGIAVGIRKGRTGRVIVLGGHIDSAGPEIPGANDDGSGSAVVLEAARVLCSRETESTILFALFGGEEQGLEGSRYFVDHYPGLDSVVLMIQTDMANGLGDLILDPDTHGARAPGWLVRAAVEEYRRLGYSNMVYPLFYFTVNYAQRNGSGSDHEPFLQAGIPAVDFTTDVNDPIHTPQDSYENFDQAGLKRSGDLVVSLTRKFDAGVPSRETEQYWLWLFFSTPVIISYPLLWIFVLLTILFSGFTLYRLRKHHLLLRSKAGYREWKWPGFKIFLVSLFAALLAWMSPDLIGLIKGERYPWFAHPNHYYILGVIALVFGLLVGLRIVGRFRITGSPYVLYKRAAIMLIPVTILCTLGGIELAVFPALCLFLVSFAVTTGNFVISVPLAVAAPIGLFRLIFSEADALMFRFTAPMLPPDAMLQILVNALWIFIIGILLTIGVTGVVAALRWAELSPRMIEALRSRRFLVITAGLFWIYSAYLVLLPSYEKPWFPTVTVRESFNAEGTVGSLDVKSSDYLRGANIRYLGTDTTINGRILEYRSGDSALPNPGWVQIVRNEERTETDSGVRYDVALMFSSEYRPYTVDLTMEADSGMPPEIRTPWRVRAGKSIRQISWYSYPEPDLRIPLSFFVPAGREVREEIVVVFDTLAIPVTVQYRQSNILHRTEIDARHRYPGGSRIPPTTE